MKMSFLISQIMESMDNLGGEGLQIEGCMLSGFFSQSNSLLTELTATWNATG